MTISKTTFTGYIGTAAFLLTIAATVPTEVQKQIMECVPKSVQPWIALVFALVSGAARITQAHFTADSPPNPKA